MIETRTYLLKESRVIGAIGIFAPATTKRPESRGFQMSNMYGQTEEVCGKSYDKGHGGKAEGGMKNEEVPPQGLVGTISNLPPARRSKPTDER